MEKGKVINGVDTAPTSKEEAIDSLKEINHTDNVIVNKNFYYARLDAKDNSESDMTLVVNAISKKSVELKVDNYLPTKGVRFENGDSISRSMIQVFLTNYSTGQYYVIDGEYLVQSDSLVNAIKLFQAWLPDDHEIRNISLRDAIFDVID